MKKQIKFFIICILSLSCFNVSTMYFPSPVEEKVDFYELMQLQYISKKDSLAQSLIAKAGVNLQAIKIGEEKVKPVIVDWVKSNIAFERLGSNVIAIQFTSVYQKDIVRCGYFGFVNSQILGMYNDADTVIKILNDDNYIENAVNNTVDILSEKGWECRLVEGMDERKKLTVADIAMLNSLWSYFLTLQNKSITFFDLVTKPKKILFPRGQLLNEVKNQCPMSGNNGKKIPLPETLRSSICFQKKIQRTVLEFDQKGNIIMPNLLKIVVENWKEVKNELDFNEKNANQYQDICSSFEDFKNNKTTKEIYIGSGPSHFITVRAEKIIVNNKSLLALILVDSYYGEKGGYKVSQGIKEYRNFLANLSARLGYKI